MNSYKELIEHLTEQQRETKRYPDEVTIKADTYNTFTPEQKFDLKAAGIKVKLVIDRPDKRVLRKYSQLR